MFRIRGAIGVLFCLAALLLAPVFVQPALAQAWTPRAQQSSLSIAYQFNNGGDHLFSSDLIEGGINFGDAVDFGEITGQTVQVVMDYGLTDRWALSGGVAYVKAKYDGDFPEADIDDGSYHGDLQDFNLTLRYRATDGAVAVTPFVGVILPTQDYATFGHAAVGRGLSELQLGVLLGWFQRSTGFYLQGSYMFAIVESVADFNLDRSEIGIELGYFLNRKWSIRTFGTYRHTNGGIDWIESDFTDPVVVFAHDQASKVEDFRAGIGTNIKLTWNMNLFVDYGKTIDGENTHEGTVTTAGLTWTFGGANIGRTARRIGNK